ncbi:hypothetical protein ACVINW_000583 [Bradyrhizobium sp. USDA 4461]
MVDIPVPVPRRHRLIKNVENNPMQRSGRHSRLTAGGAAAWVTGWLCAG